MFNGATKTGREAALEALADCLRKDYMTPGWKVGPGTFLCIAEKTMNGTVYHQAEFEKIVPSQQKMFDGKTRGFTTERFKLLAVFDIWPEAL